MCVCYLMYVCGWRWSVRVVVLFVMWDWLLVCWCVYGGVVCWWCVLVCVWCVGVVGCVVMCVDIGVMCVCVWCVCVVVAMWCWCCVCWCVCAYVVMCDPIIRDCSRGSGCSLCSRIRCNSCCCC